jgi:hypothetical protein
MYVYSREIGGVNIYDSTKTYKNPYVVSNLVGAEMICNQLHWLKTDINLNMTCYGNYFDSIV